MKNRIFSLLLCVAMLLTLLPQTALFASAVTYSGTCGANLHWSFDESTDILTITGTGNMYNWSLYNDKPWQGLAFRTVCVAPGVTSIGASAFVNNKTLESVNVPNSVTSIGNYAFYGCSSLLGIDNLYGLVSIGEAAFWACNKLVEIKLPNSCTSIGRDAFADCRSLESVILSDKMTEIPLALFNGCSSLTNIVIPDSVTSISNSFGRCTSLRNIYIPKNVTWVEQSAFYGCTSLNSIMVSPENHVYDSRNNCNAIIESSRNRLITGCMATVIPDSVTSISPSAFRDCSTLTHITIPNSVTTIGGGAFSGCSGLTNITIPASVTSIGNEAFRFCTGSLTDIAIQNPSCTIYNGSYTLSSSSKTTIYGYPNSTAETYAKCYGYTFKTLDQYPGDLTQWTGGSIYNADTGKLTLTTYVNQKDCHLEKENYVLADTASAVYDGITYRLESGSTYKIGEGNIPYNIATCGDGQICLPYTGGSVTVYKDGYVSRTLTEKQLKNGASVYLQKESGSYPVISGLWMDDTDIMNYEYAVNLTDSGAFTVTPEISWGSGDTGTVRLMQGAHSLSLSVSGTTVTWSNQFDVSEPIYIEATGTNGKTTRKALKLAAATAIPDCLDGLTVNWGDGIGFALPKAAGPLAGEKMNIGIFSPIKVDAVIDGGKVYLAIGYENGADWKKDGNKHKKDVKSWTEDIKDLKKNYSPSNFEKFAKKNYNKIAKTGGSFGFDADFSVVGFGEGYIDESGKIVLLDAGLIVGCDGSVSYSYPFLIAGVVPAFVEAKFKADLEAHLNLYINDSAKNFTPNGEIQFDVSLSGGLGLGVSKVASVSGGLNGKLANTWDINLGETNYFRMVASLNLYAKVSFLFLSYRHDFDPILQATWIEYPSPKKSLAATEATDISDIYDIENYELQDLSYLYAGSVFLAASSNAKHGTKKSVSVSDAVFLQNAYENSKPQIVTFADGTMLAAWIGYDGSHTGYDALCLYYSYYDGTEWSQPTVVEDDGTYDGDFALKSANDTAFVLWQNAEQPIGTEPKFEEVAGLLSMSAGIFDSENGTFRTATLSAQDGTLDMQPVLCGNGNTAYAVWLNNSENSVFGDNSENAILCSRYNGSEWSAAQILYDGLTSVESLAADFDGTDLNVAYCTDTDGDIFTSEDLELWRNGVRQTENEVCDSGVSFCDGELYWYQDGNLTSGEETPVLTGMETDRYQIAANGESKVLVYNLYSGLYSTLYARYYDNTSAAWGEPIALTDGTDSFNAFSASMDADGKLSILANRVAVTGQMTDENPYGQADIVMRTVTPKTDLAVTDIFYDCSEYTEDADMTFTVSVKNNGEVAVHGMTAVVSDANGNELGRSLIPGTLLSGAETDISCGFKPEGIQLGRTVTVSVLPMNIEDENSNDNTVEATLDFKDISLENTAWGFNTDNQAVIYTDVVNRSYAATTAPITVSLRENSESGTVLDSVTVNNLDALEAERVSFTTRATDGKVLYVTVETQTENEYSANDSDFVVLTLPEDFPDEDNTDTLKIRSASLRIDEDIDIIFTVQVPDGYANPCLTVNGTALARYTEQNGDLCFLYSDITPQRMGDCITATLTAEKDGETFTDVLENYSVRKYCINLLNNPDYNTDEALVTLLSDLLTYGAAAQVYMDYKTDSLVTVGLDLTPSSFAAFDGMKASFTGTQDADTHWTAAILVLSNDLATRFTFNAKSIDGLTVEVSINGRTQTFDAFEDAGNGKYCITFDGIKATEFDDTVTAKFYRNGERVGAAVNYSVNTYICGAQNSANEVLACLVKALYNYGASAKAYAD